MNIIPISIRIFPNVVWGYQDYGNENQGLRYPDKYLNYRLCYSLHSSFSEIVDVLKTLKPQRVTPIAAPFTTLLTTKRLFQLIDYFIKGNKLLPMERAMRKLERKTIHSQIQLKHRYESFETKMERKRRRRLFKEQQQRKANDEELEFGIKDQKEEQLSTKNSFIKSINSTRFQVLRSLYVQKKLSSDK